MQDKHLSIQWDRATEPPGGDSDRDCDKGGGDGGGRGGGGIPMASSVFLESL